jgi:hypothetical protein
MEIALRNIPNDYRNKYQTFNILADETQILILGNSHTLHDLNPAFFSKITFNYANPSQLYCFDELIIKSYIKKMNHLEWIILPVSYFSYYRTREDSEEMWRFKNYVLYSKVYKSPHIKDNSEVLGNQFRFNLRRLYKNYVVKEPNAVCDSLGFAYNYLLKDQQDLKKTVKHTIKSHDKGNEESIAVNIELLKRVIKMAQERNVKVLLITPPGSKDYQKLLNSNKLKKVINISTNLTKYKDVFYINMLSDPRFNDTDFYDSDHLNVDGAEKLSKIINHYITKHQ